MESSNLEEDLNNKKRQVERLDAGVAAVDMLDLSTIFSMFTSTLLHAFFETIGRYIFFPIALAANVLRAGFSWREAYLKKWKPHPLIKMCLETLGSLAVAVAIIGSLVAPVMFALVSPILFTTVLTTKVIYNAAESIYYGVKAAQANDLEQKQQYTKKALGSGMMAIALGLATVGVVSVFIFGKLALAACAIAGGLIGASVAGFRLFQTFLKPKETKKPLLTDCEPEPEAGNTQAIFESIAGVSPEIKQRRKVRAQRQETERIEALTADKIIDPNPPKVTFFVPKCKNKGDKEAHHDLNRFVINDFTAKRRLA